MSPRTIIGFYKSENLYGGASFTRKKPFTQTELATLKFFSTAIHEEFSRPIIERLNEKLGLTAGEKLCLEFASHGYTSDEIASQSKYSVETVNTYLKWATQKLNAFNRAHAIAEALRRNLIH